MKICNVLFLFLIGESQEMPANRRVKCDTLPRIPGTSPVHGACSAHCVAKNIGHKSGRCINGVCNCRNKLYG